MAMIRATWFGDECWKQLGGGANPWDSIAYDPELDLVYVGTGNASPHSRYYRSNNEGDNLFVCSIVALHAEDGSYAWHYQMNPGEEWDWTCTSSIITADLDDRRQAAQGADAGAEERVLLRARPRDRRVHQRQEPRDAELERRLRRQRPADHQRGGALRLRSGAGHAGAGRGAQLVPDGLQPAHRAGLFPGLPVGLRLRAGAQLDAAADALEQRLGRLHRRGGGQARRRCRRRPTRSRRPG